MQLFCCIFFFHQMFSTLPRRLALISFKSLSSCGWHGKAAKLRCLQNGRPGDQDVTGDVYFFNFFTGESTWDHPCTEFYRQQVSRERERAKSCGTPGKKKERKTKKEKGKKDKEFTRAPV
ncbi:hypothetical protein Z043_115511, partial [Scleropages formosus]